MRSDHRTGEVRRARAATMSRRRLTRQTAPGLALALLLAIGALAGGGVGAPAGALSPPPPEAIDERWARTMRIDLVGYPATPDQLQGVLDARAAGRSRLSITAELTRSRGHHRLMIPRAYRQVLGRTHDPAGLTYWEGRLRTGTSSTTFIASLAASDEMWRRGGSTPEGWVDAVYRALLGRPASAADAAAWAEKLASTPRGAIARAIRGSSEARGRVVDTEYRLLLGRAADPAGRASWIAQLRTLDDRDLRARLTASDEHVTRAQRRLDGLPTEVSAGPVELPSDPAAISADGRFLVNRWAQAATFENPRPTVRLTDLHLATSTTIDLGPEAGSDDDIGAALPTWVDMSDDGQVIVAAVRPVRDYDVVCIRDVCLRLGTAGPEHLLVHDRRDGSRRLVRDSEGAPVTDGTGEINLADDPDLVSGMRPSISADGTTVVISRVRPELEQRVIDRIDLTTSAVETVVAGNGPSEAPTLSPDGSTVVFSSASSDLTPDSDGGRAAFVRRSDGSITRLAPIPKLRTIHGVSSDGAVVAVLTEERLTPDDLDDTLDAYRWDLVAGGVELVSPSPEDTYLRGLSPRGEGVAVSHDGERIVTVVTGSPTRTGVLAWSRRDGVAFAGPLTSSPVPGPALLSGDGATVAVARWLWRLPAPPSSIPVA